jgi:hypothetical protein
VLGYVTPSSLSKARQFAFAPEGGRAEAVGGEASRVEQGAMRERDDPEDRGPNMPWPVLGMETIALKLRGVQGG